MNLYPNNEQRGDQHIDTQPDLDAERATVEREKLTDGSSVYNVSLVVNGTTVRCGCEDKDSAADLMEALNACSWIEVR